MAIDRLLTKLSGSPELEALGRELRAGRRPSLENVPAQARAWILLATLDDLCAPVLWLCPSTEFAESLYGDLACLKGESFREEVALFPEEEIASSEEGAASSERMEVLHRLSAGKVRIVISTVKALLQGAPAPSRLRDAMLTLREGEEYDREDLLARLVAVGYRGTAMIEAPGEFAVRGMILDIYPSSGGPVRAEFWDERLESLKLVDIDTQRSAGRIGETCIYPLNEACAPGSSLTDFIPPGSHIFLEEPSRCRLHLMEFADAAQPLLWEDVERILEGRPVLEVANWQRDGAARPGSLAFSFGAAESFGGKLEAFLEHMAGQRGKGASTIIITRQKERFTDVMREAGLRVVQEGEGPLKPGDILLMKGTFSGGFTFPQEKLLLLTDREILGRIIRRGQLFKSSEKRSAFSLEDLRPSEYVVHLRHGIGVFRGVARLAVEGKWRDFLELEFKGTDKLFVPVEQMDMIQKYVGVEGKAPHLSRLGGQDWAKTKRKVQESTEEIARGLLELYAEREKGAGFPFAPDSLWQMELEASFPFEETPDQYKAIQEVKAAMESGKPMERLICGDAGYGKTEVALRAAFKAAMNGKQTAILVPTTILAQQHFSTFRERLAPYPVNVEMLSRFRTPAEQRKIVEDLKLGLVDIIIGTHRLISHDVEFKDLGLVIIDEEQHFGVHQKERLKQLRRNVDILSLTATPIPRTLYMSVAGIRDMSVIDTPPEDRRAVKTWLFEYDPAVIRAALLRELERDGQAFVIHHRVHGIEQVAKAVQKLLPQARVAVAHGQMDEERLEKIMIDFLEGEYDILVCTTIIESGLDIPRANTIIINNAHHFGLAQLYQLRGRVGRGHHQAYAYLLYPPKIPLTDDAVQRLETLREFTGLGSGYRIAMRDLEIRGAGNLLGVEQHGNIAAVGFDLYCQLLAEAVAAARGETPRRRAESPVLDLPVQAYLPESFIPDSRQKLAMYRKLALVGTPRELEDMRDELRDRYGALPREVTSLLRLIALKFEVIARGVAAIRSQGGRISVLHPLAKELPGEVRKSLSRACDGHVEFREYHFLIEPPGDDEDPVQLLLTLLSHLPRMDD